MNVSNYLKRFIILKTLYSNMKDLSPKGHGRLEAKGQNLSIGFSVQGAESTNYYDVLVIGDEKAHRLGSIYTEDNRNGTVEFKVNLKDLEKLGFPLEKINGILIIRNSNILLGGYFQRDDGTIDTYIASMDNEEKVENKPIEASTEILEDPSVQVYLEEIPEVSMEEILPEEIYVEEDVREENPEVQEDIEEIPQTEAEKVPEEETKEITEVTAKEYELDLEDIFSSIENTYEKDYEDYYLQYKPRQADYDLEYLINLLNYYPYIEPFKLNLGGYNWWRIDITDLDNEKNFLPYFDYIISRDYNHPLTVEYIGARQLIKRYNHYIFGLYENKEGLKFYIYGIPGLFKIDQYPRGGTTGFNTWYEGKDSTGYWLLYMEPHTGRVIYPVNPMIPTE